MVPDGDAASLESVPWVHVGVFKSKDLRTESEGIVHRRNLLSSSTTGAASSVIPLDDLSSSLQSESSRSILADFIGPSTRPLLILDSARSLRSRGQVSARIAAALSLNPFASFTSFITPDTESQETIDLDVVAAAVESEDEVLVYGFTWVLWKAWAMSDRLEQLRSILDGKRVVFVHSGGWKKLEEIKVDAERFESQLLEGLGEGSKVLDYYGLVEQVGVIYPLCEAGFRHTPVWADVFIRDPWSGASLCDEVGQLQLLNCLAHGAPYHSVLTEDLGMIHTGSCDCGRSGKRFELLGRMPRAEVRGCANV